MKAKTKCPNCGEVVIDDCEGCVSGGNLMHCCGENEEPEIYNVKWEILECNEKEAKILKKLGFQGEIPGEF